MWPTQPEDLVRHITKGDIRPLMQWYGDGVNNKLGQPKRSFSPPRSASASRKPVGKLKRPTRPPSAPLLSMPGNTKPVRPQTAAGGHLYHASSAALLQQALVGHPPLLQPKRTAKARMPASATQAELTRLKRTSSGGALPPRRLADDLLEGPVVLGGAGGGGRPAEYTGGVC